MNSATIVQKLWNYCNVLRDDGMSYCDYVEQLTYLLFLKMADERSRPPYNQASLIPEPYAWPALLKLGPLARYTPCRPAPDAQLANALAVVHAELILVHRFREGNGRVARLLAMLMGLQAGLPPLDFSPLEGRGKARYIAGIHASLDRDYAPLAEMFLRVIARTWKRAASSIR